MTKTVVLLSVLCLLVLGAAVGVIQVLGRVAADLHRGTIALDALVVRVADVEQDLATMSEDVASIADEVSIIADSLAVEEDDEQGGEAVRLERPAQPRSPRRAVRAERARRREPRVAAIAAHRSARQRPVLTAPEASASH